MLVPSPYCAYGISTCTDHSGDRWCFLTTEFLQLPVFLTKIARSPAQPRAAPRSPAPPRAAPRSPAQSRAALRIFKVPFGPAKREASGALAHPRALSPAPAFSAHLSNLSPGGALGKKSLEFKFKINRQNYF